MKNTFLKIEQAVLEMLLAGSIPLLVELRRQFEVCTIKKRKFTGHGFFTDFSVPEETQKRVGLDLVLDDVLGEDISGLQNGAGFLLFIKDGILDYLEGFSYEERWPESVNEFKLTYSKKYPGTPPPHKLFWLSAESERDWTSLEKSLHMAAEESNLSQM